MSGLVGLWVPCNWQLWSHTLGVVHRPFSLKHRGRGAFIFPPQYTQSPHSFTRHLRASDGEFCGPR